MELTDKTPTEIKIEMLRYGVTQAEIGRKCQVTQGHVHRVISGQSISNRVQKVIAKAINLPVTEVFPARYTNRGKSSRLQPSVELAAS